MNIVELARAYYQVADYLKAGDFQAQAPATADEVERITANYGYYWTDGYFNAESEIRKILDCIPRKESKYISIKAYELIRDFPEIAKLLLAFEYLEGFIERLLSEYLDDDILRRWQDRDNEATKPAPTDEVEETSPKDTESLTAPGNEPQQSPETPLISNEAEQIADSPAPAQTSASGKKTGKAGRPKAGHGNFLDFIIKETEEEKEAFLTKLHSQIDGNKGKVAGQTIRVCVKLGVMLKPSFKDMVNEFGDIGARKGYESYVDGLDTNGCECEVSNEYRAKVKTTLGLK